MAPETPTGAIVVRCRAVTKTFGGTRALDAVDWELRAGEVHALVGENGAGKSTLGKVVAGVHRPDAGDLVIDGTPVGGRWSPRRATGLGVAMIHQELSLVPDRSVAENVFLGIEDARWGVLRRGLRQRYDELEARCRFGIDPAAPVRSLRLADQQKVEILRALAREARVIIMDEPTSALTADEAVKLHEVVGWLRSEGRSVVYVTHFLDHVLDHADRVTIMRDGRLVRTAPASDETKSTLVEAMLGEPLDVAFPDRPPPPTVTTPAADGAPDGDRRSDADGAPDPDPTTGSGADSVPALEVRGLVVGDVVRGVDLVAWPGEIVGLAGLVGSGRTELARAIFGADPSDAGEVWVEGRRYDRRSPRASVRRRLVYVPEDRRSQGLVMTMPVRPNVTLPHLRTFARAGVVGGGSERDAVGGLLDRLGVVPRRVDGDVATLSGGNQQKVLFAKWLLDPPAVAILDEPTRGVDVGAKRRIYEVIVELARAGTAVVLISSELEEVLGLSHRVVLLRHGRVVGEVHDPDPTSVDDVLYRLFDVEKVS